MLLHFRKWHHDVFLGEYSGMGTKTEEFDRAMRHTLTRNTAACLASFVDEIDYAIGATICECDNWTTFNARKLMSEIASIMSGRVFIGLPHSRDKDWVEASCQFIGDVSMSWMILRMIPWPLKALIAPILPPIRSLQRHKKLHHARVVEALAESGYLEGNKRKEKNDAGGEMMRWLVEQYDEGQVTPQKIARDELLATFASIYNLSNALTYMLFDLATLSENDIAELREEAEQINGEMTINTLSKLVKLDSFLRESMRLSPPSTGTFSMQPTSPQQKRTALIQSRRKSPPNCHKPQRHNPL
jgi:gliotoxin biosynthesis cytochrome P450 monooxygenase